MSDLESEAKLLLASVIKYGDPLSFLPLGVDVLASFAFKGTLICDYVNRTAEKFFPVSVRDNFRLRLEIPPGIQMWIGACGTVGAPISGMIKPYVFEVPTASGPLSNAEFFCFNWAVGHIALQVLATRWKDFRRKYGELPSLTPDERWNAVSIRFCSNDGKPVTWDPTHHLGSESLDIFADRFKSPVVVGISR